jgi:methylphosphotriester-DNA--protein-cysteine methyltransferase
VSPSLLDERFREVLGVPPIRYLTGWRMHLAEDLLRSTDLALVAVARKTGTSPRRRSAAPSNASTVWRPASGACARPAEPAGVGKPTDASTRRSPN